MLTISLFFLLFVIFTVELHPVVKYAYHQVTDLCNRKPKIITAPIVNFAFVFLHLFEGTHRISEI